MRKSYGLNKPTGTSEANWKFLRKTFAKIEAPRRLCAGLKFPETVFGREVGESDSGCAGGSVVVFAAEGLVEPAEGDGALDESPELALVQVEDHSEASHDLVVGHNLAARRLA